MNGLNFIREELRSKYHGKISVWYNKQIEILTVHIYLSDKIDYYYRKYFPQKQFDSQKALTVVLNDININYSSYLKLIYDIYK